MRRVGTVVLAAGKGTRMRSRYPKVTHQVAGRAMIEHVLRAAGEAVSVASSSASPASSPSSQSISLVAAGAGQRESQIPASTDTEDDSPRFIVVLGHEREQVRAALHWTPSGSENALTYVIQDPQLGTGDAVRATAGAWRQSRWRPTTILALYGDTPLLRAETLRTLLEEHQASGATLTFLTGIADDPKGYGRVLRDQAGQVAGIVEERHTSPSEADIREVNSGVYCIEAEWLWPHLESLEVHSNGEYYLTDLVGIAVAEGQKVSTVSAPLEETMGVNDRLQLAEAERIMRRRILRDLMLGGVTIEDPDATYVDAGVQVGEDTVLRPGTILRGATSIGEACDIGPGSVVVDSTIRRWLHGDGILAGVGDHGKRLSSWPDEPASSRCAPEDGSTRGKFR